MQSCFDYIVDLFPTCANNSVVPLRFEILDCDSCLPKRPTSLVFPQSSSPTSVLVADAFGDVYQLSKTTAIDLSQDDRADSACILGHFSTVTHVDVRGSHIATADRDARVRISHWPQVYVIRAFCLGHSDVVTVAKILPNNKGVISAALDGTIRLWSLDGHLCNSLAVDSTLLTLLDVVNENSKNSSRLPIVALITHPSDQDAALFVVDGANAVFQLTGLSQMTLGNVSVLIRYSSPVTGIAIDSITNSMWVTSTGSCTVDRFLMGERDSQLIPEQRKDSICLNLSDKSVVEESVTHIGRYRWLLNQRKKEMVTDWKGKKRRHVEI